MDWFVKFLHKLFFNESEIFLEIKVLIAIKIGKENCCYSKPYFN